MLLPKFGEGDEYELKAADHRVYTDPKVLAWREGALLDAGFRPDEALQLAKNADIDLHAACLLRRRTELAFEILS